MGFFSKLNPVKAVKKAFNKVTGKDARDKAKEEARRQEAELAAQKKKQQSLLDQQQRKSNGNEADSSQLSGLGDFGADSGPGDSLTGLGGISTDDLKLQKKKLLGA